MTKTVTATPKVGTGATLVVGSDCYAYTVTGVSATGYKISVRRCEAKLISGTMLSEHQVYEYSEIEDADTQPAYRADDGTYRLGGSRLYIGQRRAYRDPSF